jgi:hypothetical protein
LERPLEFLACEISASAIYEEESRSMPLSLDSKFGLSSMSIKKLAEKFEKLSEVNFKNLSPLFFPEHTPTTTQPEYRSISRQNEHLDWLSRSSGKSLRTTLFPSFSVDHSITCRRANHSPSAITVFI